MEWLGSIHPRIVWTVLFSAAVFLRAGISRGPHSGQGMPPMYGDYEAQRHWQEITYNLPISEWYVNTTDNDLNYWGLDYPPLTALHSYCLGHIAAFIDPTWVALHLSRGEEGYLHKLFMRLSVMVEEVIYLGPLIILVCRMETKPSRRYIIAAMVLLTPGQPLIDHGHFQYNNCSLGLTIAAVLAIISNYLCTGSALFVLALNYKQMSLYHALPFFSYLLSKACAQKSWSAVKQILLIGLTVIVTFGLCWAPFYQTLPHLLIRMFPFNRGLFEDKVGNFWCSLSLIIKIQHIFDRLTLVRMALFTTLISVLPSQFHLFRNPSPDRFILALTNSALGFFLFSFHVHEKTILIPAVTVLLLYGQCPLAAVWFQTVATFSMYPLLLKDGQQIMYIASLGLFLTLSLLASSILITTRTSRLVITLFIASMCGMVVLHLAEVLVEPPEHLPFIYPTLNAAYSALHFGLFFCYFHWLQYNGLPDMFVCPRKKD